jgi:hypothetical protein
MDFTLSASIVWGVIAFIWTLEKNSFDKSILTFIAGGMMLPFALLFSKLLKTTWTNKDNPLQPLGLWLNFAQLFYFPFLIFILIKAPDNFILVYGIITAAHFFPYSWFYKTLLYAIFAGVLTTGLLLMGLKLPAAHTYIIPASLSSSLLLLTILLYFDSGKKLRIVEE